MIYLQVKRIHITDGQQTALVLVCFQTAILASTALFYGVMHSFYQNSLTVVNIDIPQITVLLIPYPDCHIYIYICKVLSHRIKFSTMIKSTSHNHYPSILPDKWFIIGNWF